MRSILRIAAVLAIAALASWAVPAQAVGGTSTCESLCRTPTGGLVRQTEQGVTQSACCSGEALPCPPGDTLLADFWGNPLGFCPE